MEPERYRFARRERVQSFLGEPLRRPWFRLIRATRPDTIHATGYTDGVWTILPNPDNDPRVAPVTEFLPIDPSITSRRGINREMKRLIKQRRR
jgi:hypothetical protein